MTLWQQFIDVSITYSEEVYSKLNVKLTRDDIMGESAYNEDLTLPSELKQVSCIRYQGAKVVLYLNSADR